MRSWNPTPTGQLRDLGHVSLYLPPSLDFLICKMGLRVPICWYEAAAPLLLAKAEGPNMHEFRFTQLM